MIAISSFKEVTLLIENLSDAMCSGRDYFLVIYPRLMSHLKIGHEHVATEIAPGKPSYCTLPMFHPPQTAYTPEVGGVYVSNDGHRFLCRNPALNS